MNYQQDEDSCSLAEVGGSKRWRTLSLLALKARRPGGQEARRPGDHCGGHDLSPRPRVAAASPEKSTINPRGRDYIMISNLHVRSVGAALKRRRMKSSFSSSSPDDVTTITATDAAPADNAKAPTKDNSQEEAADGTAGTDGLSDALATTDGGGGSSSHHHQHHSTNFNHSNRGLKIKLIIKSIYVMLFTSIYYLETRSPWRFRLPCPLSQHRRKSAPW